MRVEQKLVSRLDALMDDPCVRCECVQIDEEIYFVTTGTGEGSFAYIQEEFESGIEAAEKVESGMYQEFCDSSNPVSNNPDLARQIYDELEIRICNPGGCEPMFYDEDD